MSQTWCASSITEHTGALAEYQPGQFRDSTTPEDLNIGPTQPLAGFEVTNAAVPAAFDRDQCRH